MRHKGPGSEFKKTYGPLMGRIKGKEFELSGPPMQIYSKEPDVVGG